MELYPEPVTKHCTKTTLDQMNESFYKIKKSKTKI